LAPPNQVKLILLFLANDYSNGSRGAVPDERKNNFGITPGVIFNSHQFVIDGSVPFKSERTFHNLEPFVPIVSWTTKGHQVPLPIKFKFPSGQLLVTVTDPEGQVSTLGPAVFKGTYLNEPYANWGTIGGMAERRLSSILNSLPSVISSIIHLINTANTRLQLREVF
jgi:hypothetical protein